MLCYLGRLLWEPTQHQLIGYVDLGYQTQIAFHFRIFSSIFQTTIVRLGGYIFLSSGTFTTGCRIFCYIFRRSHFFTLVAHGFCFYLGFCFSIYFMSLLRFTLKVTQMFNNRWIKMDQNISKFLSKFNTFNKRGKWILLFFERGHILI